MRWTGNAFASTAIVAAAVLVGGCASPSAALDRSLLPGLGKVPEQDIGATFDKEVKLALPASAGIAWLENTGLSEYHRTGVLNVAAANLGREPFGLVASLPTVEGGARLSEGGDAVALLRGACARFQYDVALLLQTGVGVDEGLNVFAIGYLPYVTRPLFPGNDLEVAASAELCAIDVRTGILLGNARGRAQKSESFIRPQKMAAVQGELTETALNEAIAQAATNLRDQLALRFAAK